VVKRVLTMVSCSYDNNRPVQPLGERELLMVEAE
jgi:hypothetical protein